MMRLPQHRAKAAHLPHQPLQNGLAFWPRLNGHQFACFLGKVEQNGTGFKDTHWLSIKPFMIDNCGDLVVRADGQKV